MLNACQVLLKKKKSELYRAGSFCLFTYYCVPGAQNSNWTYVSDMMGSQDWIYPLTLKC